MATLEEASAQATQVDAEIVAYIQQLQAEGHAWAPHIPWLYTNATAYLAEHPHQGHRRMTLRGRHRRRAPRSSSGRSR